MSRPCSSPHLSRSERSASQLSAERRSEIGVGERVARPFQNTRADPQAVEQHRLGSLSVRAAAWARTQAPAAPWAVATRRRACPRTPAFVTGRVAARFTGPATSLVSRWTMRPTSSSSEIQLIHWRPEPKRPPRPSLNSGSIFASAAPLARQHDPRSQVHDPRRRPPRRALWPPPTPGTRRRGTWCPTATPRRAPRRPGRRSTSIAEPDSSTRGPPSIAAIVLDEQRRRPRPALPDLPLVLVRPPVVADPGAGEVDDRVDADQLRGLQPTGRRIPTDVVAGRERTSRTTS